MDCPQIQDRLQTWAIPMRSQAFQQYGSSRSRLARTTVSRLGLSHLAPRTVRDQRSVQEYTREKNVLILDVRATETRRGLAFWPIRFALSLRLSLTGMH